MVDDEAWLFAVRQKGNLPIIHYNWLLPWPYKWTLRDLEQPEEFQFDHHPLAPHHPNRPWPRVFPPDPSTVTTSPSKQQQKFGKQWAVLPVLCPGRCFLRPLPPFPDHCGWHQQLIVKQLSCGAAGTGSCGWTFQSRASLLLPSFSYCLTLELMTSLPGPAATDMTFYC